MTKKIRVYVSHSIRGIKGADATNEDMVANNVKAVAFGKELRRRFPNVDFYIPGDGDEFVMLAYQSKFLDEYEILNVDCQIIDVRDVVLAYIPDQYISNGMLIEVQHAHKTGKPIFLVKDIEQAEQVLNRYLGGLLT